jgi:pimeloyl-ACP methyl ester carboxylesterase
MRKKVNMRKTLYATFVLLVISSCKEETMRKENNKPADLTRNDSLPFKNGYSEVNGIKMYYELYGKGKPLVLLHGGGSTIQTSFGRIIPILAKQRQLICIELQAHGRTSDRNVPISFEQDANDVVALMKNLNISKTDILGFSNGGNTALYIAIKHPEVCNKIIAASPLLKRNGAAPQFWEFMKHGTFAQMPQALKEGFLKVTPDSAKLMNMYQKCADRMNNFSDVPDELLKSIQRPVLFINGNTDVALPEHIVAMCRLISGSQMAIVPGGHGDYLGEVTTLKPGYKDSDFVVPMMERFLEE